MITLYLLLVTVSVNGHFEKHTVDSGFPSVQVCNTAASRFDHMPTVVDSECIPYHGTAAESH